MRTIYIDADFKCHTADDGTQTAVETDAFDGKCDAFIEGFRFVPKGASWTRPDGITFAGPMRTPFKPLVELESAQKDHDIAQMADMEAALTLLGVAIDG